MKITIKYNNIDHTIMVDDDITLGDAEILFKRLLMCVGYQYGDYEGEQIITRSNKIIGVDENE